MRHHPVDPVTRFTEALAAQKKANEARRDPSTASPALIARHRAHADHQARIAARDAEAAHFCADCGMVRVRTAGASCPMCEGAA